MSNILIIKHGSLGDIAQASGAIQDISDFHKDDKVYLLTSKPYIDLFKKNPYLEDIILDKRLSRFNVIYLFNLMRKLKKYKFQKLLTYEFWGSLFNKSIRALLEIFSFTNFRKRISLYLITI